MALAGSAAIAVLGVALARPAFTANAVPAASLEGAVGYTVVLCCGCAGPFLMNAAAAFLKAQGDARTPLQLVGVSALVNVALDLVLVGPAGVGALVVVRRRFPGGRLAGAFSRSGDVPVGASVIEVLRVGVPSAVQMAVVNLSYALVTGLLNRYGTDVAAAPSRDCRAGPSARPSPRRRRRTQARASCAGPATWRASAPRST